jgi:hypothetical protein
VCFDALISGRDSGSGSGFAPLAYEHPFVLHGAGDFGNHDSTTVGRGACDQGACGARRFDSCLIDVM